jgi:FkbM family methyltransferase
MLIPLPDLVSRFHITPTGFFHVGAHEGQELTDYIKLSPHIIFVEADPKTYKTLQANCGPYTSVQAHCALFAEADGMEVTFHRANHGGQSSSVLELAYHALAHPEVRFVEDIKLTTSRADTFCEWHGIDLAQYDFLNVDVQGVELSVLKGMGDMLHKINYAYIEVNEKELYRGCPLVGEIDEYLNRYGLRPRQQHMTGWGWGDKYYERGV